MHRRFLAHPLTRNLELDNPATTQARRQILREKKFLNLVYRDWYRLIYSSINNHDGLVLELGSGGGFLADYLPGLIASEVFYIQGVNIILDGRHLPVQNHSLDAIVMVDVLHHIHHVEMFFNEACRCLRPGGVIVMIEPWVTPWSTWVYINFHHEPFDTKTDLWDFPSNGPVSSANGALPWILFMRDRQYFTERYPELLIELIKPMMPFRYLLSGGISTVSLMPGWTYRFWAGIDMVFETWAENNAMFALIVIKKVSHSGF